MRLLAVLISSSFSNNQTASFLLDDSGYLVAHGGGIYNAKQADLFMKDFTLDGNLATGLGGGLYNEGYVKANEGVITLNSAKRGGGGVSNSGMLEMDRSTLSGNINWPRI